MMELAEVLLSSDPTVSGMFRRGASLAIPHRKSFASMLRPRRVSTSSGKRSVSQEHWMFLESLSWVCFGGILEGADKISSSSEGSLAWCLLCHTGSPGRGTPEESKISPERVPLVGLFWDSGAHSFGTFGALPQGTLSGLFLDSSGVPGPEGLGRPCVGGGANCNLSGIVWRGFESCDANGPRNIKNTNHAKHSPVSFTHFSLLAVKNRSWKFLNEGKIHAAMKRIHSCAQGALGRRTVYR